jgi:hypothetical protein
MKKAPPCSGGPLGDTGFGSSYPEVPPRLPSVAFHWLSNASVAGHDGWAVPVTCCSEIR